MAGGGSALAAGVHDEVGVAGAGGSEVIGGESAAAGVADEGDDAGERFVVAGGFEEPGFDGVVGEACEGDVVDVDEGEEVGEALDEVRRRWAEGGGLGEGVFPEGVEVFGGAFGGVVAAKLGDGHVEVGHGDLLGKIGGRVKWCNWGTGSIGAMG